MPLHLETGVSAPRLHATLAPMYYPSNLPSIFSSDKSSICSLGIKKQFLFLIVKAILADNRLAAPQATKQLPPNWGQGAAKYCPRPHPHQNDYKTYPLFHCSLPSSRNPFSNQYNLPVTMKLHQPLTYLLTFALTSQSLALPLFSTIQQARLTLRDDASVSGTTTGIAGTEGVTVAATPETWGTAMSPEEQAESV